MAIHDVYLHKYCNLRIHILCKKFENITEYYGKNTRSNKHINTHTHACALTRTHTRDAYTHARVRTHMPLHTNTSTHIHTQMPI